MQRQQPIRVESSARRGGAASSSRRGGAASSSRRGGAASSSRRGGAVIIVVLTLMTSLAFIGLFFYTLADNELNVATNFEKKPDQVIDPDDVDDFALRQVLVSTPAANAQSALSGGQLTISGNTIFVSDKSILAHILGLIAADGTPADVRPRNGRGIGVYGTQFDMTTGLPYAGTSNQIAFDYNGDGVPDFFDYDGNGTQDAGEPSFRWNHSAAANDVNTFQNPFERFNTPLQRTAPDVDYTYPDINSPFLAYESIVTVNNTPFRIVIPSYCRPQLFPDYRNSPTAFGTLYTDAVTSAQVLRPHASHANVDGTARFVTGGGTQALSGDRNRLIGPFPFTTNINGGSVNNEMGVFTSSTSPYEYDVDADGDGILDSIWLDLDHPIIDLADGRQGVPIFYVKVVDMDALLNVNHHGHDPLVTYRSNNAAANAFTMVYGQTNNWIHASNQGASPAEINPLPALNADPNGPNDIDPSTVAAATLQHRGMLADNSTGPPTERATAFVTTDATSRVRMANTELFRLLHGSPEYRGDLTLANANPNADVSGRYGETVTATAVPPPVLRNALNTPSSGIFPSAGDTALDDDRDDNNTGNDWTGGPADNISSGISHTDDFDALLPQPLTIPHSVHPRDFTGLGNYPAVAMTYRSSVGAPNGAVRELSGLQLSMPLNPSRWVYYGTQNPPPPTLGALTPAVWQNHDNGAVPPPAGIFPWPRGANPGLGDYIQNNTATLGGLYDGLWNENDELVSDVNFPTQVDAPFPASELAALQLSDQQWQLVRENSRVRKLASFNFESSRRAATIRQQFTTDSRDRLEHGHARVTNTNRQWEFNDNFVAPNQPRFPPAYDPANASTTGPFTSRHETTPQPGGINYAADPFRPVTRRLLAIEENNQTNISGFYSGLQGRSLPGQRLDLNRLLVNFDRNGNPIYRHLTPHATFQRGDTDSNLYLTDGAGGVRPLNHTNVVYGQSYYNDGQAPLSLLDPDIPATGSYAAVPFAAIGGADPIARRFAQEAWARYDRQRMARDIYTLLYTLGGPDNLDVTTSNYPLGPDVNGNNISDLVEAMAQFAVNYVDALDQDDVITKFEYDTNLADGWNDPPSPAGFAFGVESQQLALSEVLLIQQPSSTTDNSGTLHDENRSPQVELRWLYVELRNTSPFTVPLQTGSYRLARYARLEPGRSGTLTPIRESRFTTKVAGGPASFKSIGPGENFIVACHDGQVTRGGGGAMSSDFYVDSDSATPGLEAIIPYNATSVASSSADPLMNDAAPHADLDLSVTTAMNLVDPANYDELYDNYDNGTLVPAGGIALVEPGTMSAESQLEFQLRLERRLNTNGFEFGEDASTWVEVDKWEVQGQAFVPAGSSQAEIVAALPALFSSERKQPFDFDGVPVPANPSTAYKHTLNSVALAKHTGNSAWASVNGGDGAVGFTLWQPHFNRDFTSVYDLLSVPVVGPNKVIIGLADAANTKMTGWMDSTVTPKTPFTAEGYFRHPDGQTPPSTDTTDDNRWYRLLEFVEIPSRAHDTVRNGQSIRRRTDGKINVNTLRQEPVFAGMIDDSGRDAIGPVGQLDTFNNPLRPAQDRLDGGRNWFDQLLIARDGADFFLSGAVSAPFPIPGVPGSMPFRSFSYIDPRNNGPVAIEEDPQLQNTMLRNHLTTPGLGLLDARANSDLTSFSVDYYTKNRLLSKIANNATNRSHVFAIWIGYELFEAHQPVPGNSDVVQIGARIEDLPGHREFVVADMTRLEEAFVDDPTDGIPGRFDFRKFIIYRKRIK